MLRSATKLDRPRAHLAIIHDGRLDLYGNPRPLLRLRHPIVVLITRPDSQVPAVRRKGETRDLVGETGVLFHTLLADVVPDGDGLVGSTRGEGVVAAGSETENEDHNSISSIILLPDGHPAWHSRRMISQRVDRIDTVNVVHRRSMTPERVSLRLGSIRGIKVFYGDPAFD